MKAGTGYTNKNKKYQMKFKKIVSVKLLFVILLAMSNKTFSQKLISHVDPFIGSGSHGHVFVGASVPFGAVQIGPNNIYKGWDWCSGYNYADRSEEHTSEL